MSAPRSPKSSSIGGWIAMLMVSAAIALVGGELVCRAFWKMQRGAPFFSTTCLWDAHYPQIRASGVEDVDISNTDETYDLLILGGSTISPEYGPIGKELGDALGQRLNRPVRVFDLAYAGHNSRDSMFKHRWLARQHFDLVVVYDGINDTRMNNAPPGLFRDDYSHCTWYKHLNYLDEHPYLSTATTLPFTLLYLGDRVGERAGLVWYLPRLNPRGDWVAFGKDVRTPAPYQNHLRDIVTRAKTRGERVVLMTFAYHVPANYSLEAYQAEKLDYATNGVTAAPVEIWGKPEYVVAALDQQNDAVRALVAESPDVVFVDQARLMPRSAKTFIDCCHFTAEGSTLFTQNILVALTGAFR